MPPDSPAANRAALPGEAITGRVIGFARHLRRCGFRVGPGESRDALAMLAGDGLLEPERVRATLRPLFCADAEDWQAFDREFERYWSREYARTSADDDCHAVSSPRGEDERRSEGYEGDEPDRGRADGGSTDDAETPELASTGGASATDGFARRDFQDFEDPREIAALEAYVERVARRMRRRLLRRLRCAPRGRQLSLRRTIRHSLAHGGVPLELSYRRRRRRPVQLILILDVSGSMSLYSMLFLRFARGLLGAVRDAEAFVFHTRLDRVTFALREPDTRQVTATLNEMSAGWAGGTRIGRSLRTFNEDFAGVIKARPVVVIVSDGLDTGSRDELAREMDQLHRRAGRVVWLNPLLGREGYRPLATGMKTALTRVDYFAPAHNLDSLLALEEQLVRL